MRATNSRKLSSGLVVLGFAIAFNSLSSSTHSSKDETMELEDFIIYENPRIIDAVRKRPFANRDPLIEQFFNTFPDIVDEVYQENLKTIEGYLKQAKVDMHRKMNRLTELAGLNKPPEGFVEGYQERIETLEVIFEWMQKEQPIKLVQLDIWTERDLRYRLARLPVENIRLNPETGELESRLFFNWQMISQKRARARDYNLSFAMGIHLQKQTGFYDPRGFLHWSEINKKHLKDFEISYPIILTESLRSDPVTQMIQYSAEFRTTMDSFYNIIREFFFSELADVHTLYILTRGRIFSDEWHQFQSTALQRGLAAYLVFKTLEEQVGKSKARETLEKDWTTWNLRKIGSDFNSITWDNEPGSYSKYLGYKNKPDMNNIYWSTLFVEYLVERYGGSFVTNMLGSFKKQSSNPKPEEQTFQQLTGDNLFEVIQNFLDRQNTAPAG
ncbi:MAG: hypothetical protein O3C43_01265 [Verrucomicrobia bacterium]|nr:hypothetical protein [Verrucomicrobiota bacterium]MDA1065109.1 hypothetical protein [Verrucomicrobiota bacterium]